MKKEWTKEAREYLTLLQAYAIMQQGMPISSVLDHSCPEIIEKSLHIYGDNIDQREIIRKLLKGEKYFDNLNTPTPFEDKRGYDYMLNMASQIEEAAKDKSIKICFTPLLGTIASGSINAMSVAVPRSNEYLILFNHGLFVFGNLIAKIAARALVELQNFKNAVIAGSDEFAVKIDFDPSISNDFIEAITALIVYGNPGLSKQYFPERSYNHIKHDLLLSMELFILGHEYGHVICGHFDKNSVINYAFGEVSVNEFLRSWEQEFEADEMGFILMISASLKKECNLPLVSAGAILFLWSIEILERAIEVLEFGESANIHFSQRIERINKDLENNTTKSHHPPALLRCLYIKNQILKTLPTHLSLRESKLQEHSSIINILERIIEKIWIQSLPTFIEMHLKGIRPSNCWKNRLGD
jgi:hypothetical protein